MSATKTGSFIPKEEASLIACALNKDERPGFKSKIIQQSARMEPRVIDLINLKWTTRAQLAAALKDTGLGDINARLSSTIVRCLKPKEKAPVVELLSLAMETDTELAMSGLLLLDWIDKEGTVGAFDKDEKEKAIFDSKPFFEAGVAETFNKVGGAKLLKAINALPEKYRAHGLDTYKLIIGKIPPHLKSSLHFEQLRLDLHKASRTGRKPPWTPEELCDEIASYLEMAEPAPPKVYKTYKSEDGGERARRLKGQTLDGIVSGKWHNDKFTFLTIDGDDTNNVFCHKSAIIGTKPETGDHVQFQIEYTQVDGKHRERATKVKKKTAPKVNRAAQSQTEEHAEEDTQEADPGHQIIINRSYASVVR